jgi:hypothetical protein
MKEPKGSKVDSNMQPWTDSVVNTAHRDSPLGKEFPKARVIGMALLVVALCGLCRAGHALCDAIPMHPKETITSPMLLM